MSSANEHNADWTTKLKYECYRGRYLCPHCGSHETGTRTIATSARWMLFACDACGRRFRKSARATAPLSRRLAGIADAAAQYLKEAPST